jgi:hypothetical protein
MAAAAAGALAQQQRQQEDQQREEQQLFEAATRPVGPAQQPASSQMTVLLSAIDACEGQAPGACLCSLHAA